MAAVVAPLDQRKFTVPVPPVVAILAAPSLAPYTYQWTGTSNTSTYVTSVGPGTYTCVVTDALGCTDTVVSVLAVSDLSATASASNPLCYGSGTGSVTVTAAGGTGPYSYDWAGAITSGTVLSGLGEGSYSVVVTDAYGCSTTASASVNEPAAWSVSAAVTPAVFGADGAIDMIVSGASGPYTYNWDNNATTQDLNNLDGGTYVIIITDSVGCTYTDSIVVNSIVGLDIKDLNNVQIFPNPSNGQFFIASPALNSVLLYNSFGQKVNIELTTIGDGLVVSNTRFKDWIHYKRVSSGCVGSAKQRQNHHLYAHHRRNVSYGRCYRFIGC